MRGLFAEWELAIYMLTTVVALVFGVTGDRRVPK